MIHLSDSEKKKKPTEYPPGLMGVKMREAAGRKSKEKKKVKQVE